MKCERIDRLLVAYLDGEVMPLEREEIEAHLAGCLACAEELVAMRVIRRQIGATLRAVAATAAPSSQAWPHLQQRLEAHLVAGVQQQQEVRTLGATSQDKGEARSPSWFQHLAQGVWRMLKMNPLSMEGEMKMSRKAILIAMMTLVALVSVAVFAYPPTHTLALEALTRFKSVIITNAPTVSERAQEPTPVGQPTATPIVAPLPILTVEEASEQAGFEALSPQYVPAGYQLVARGVHHAPAGGLVGATYAMEGGIPTISFSQARYVPEHVGEYSVGDAPIINVEVRGQPGLWVEQAVVGHTEDGKPWFRNILIWQEGDVFVTLRSDDLALEEMLKIAESLE